MVIRRVGVPLVSFPFGFEFYHSFWEPVFIDVWLPLSDVSRSVSFAGKAIAKLIMGVPRRFRWVTFLVSKEALRNSRVWGKPPPLCFLLIGFRFLISYVAFSRERG